LTDLSKIRNDLKSVKQVLLDGERVSFLNESTVPGFYLSSLVPIIIMLAVKIYSQIRDLNDTYALVSSEFWIN